MILLVHLLLGALIGQKISNPFLAIILAFLSHYLLDFIPHVEYPTENNTDKKEWHKIMPDVLKILLDLCLGILLILLFSKNRPIIYICAFAAMLPDTSYLLNSLNGKIKILRMHNYFHNKKIHFLRDKKISNFWRISSQVIIVVICIALLRF